MIAYTIEQAAARVFTGEATIRAWVTAGVLRAVLNPIDGHRYIQEDHLLDVEASMRIHGHAPTTTTRPLPIPELARWLWDHGAPATERAIRDWIEKGILAPTVPGARGRGHAALYDPYDALAVANTRRPT